MIFSVPEVRFLVYGIQLNVSKKILKKARLGFSYSVNSLPNKKDFPYNIVDAIPSDISISEDELINIRNNFYARYSLDVYYPPEMKHIGGSSIFFNFNGSEEALETGMRIEVEKLNKEGYVNFHFISRLESKLIE